VSSKRRPLVFICDLIHNQYAYSYCVPLNVAYLAATLEKEFGKELEIRIFKFPDELIAALADRPDVLAIANYDWNVNLNRVVIQMARADNPEVFVVMGGPNIRRGDAGTHKFLRDHRYVDAYVLYEGELAFAGLIGHMLGHEGTLRRSLIAEGVVLPQVAYLTPGQDDQLVLGGLHPSLSERDIPHPSPWLSGWLDPYLNCMSFPLVPIIETTRGCPYNCTYCTAWGTAATGIKSIRRFDLDTVYAELEYICRKAENRFYLIIGDANIGVLQRDIDIARKIRHLADTTGMITSVGIDTSKNNLLRNVEIYKILGDLSIPTFAQQSFNEDISVNIGRKNVTFEATKKLVEDVHAFGSKISTDLLVGLPGESRTRHVESIKMAFDAGFDKFQIGDIRLLLGTEMEEDHSREAYKLQTKYRIIPNAFGNYGGQRVIDYEACIRETADMDGQDFLELRLFHGHIFLMVNLEIGRPLLDFGTQYGIHPVDLIYAISEIPPANRYPLLAQLFNEYVAHSSSEWFDSQEEADEFYLQDDQWRNLAEFGFPKLNYDYASKLLTDSRLLAEFLGWGCENLATMLPEEARQYVDDVALFAEKRTVTLPLNLNEEIIEIAHPVADVLCGYLAVKPIPQEGGRARIRLFIDRNHLETIEQLADNYANARNKRHAVQLVIQFHNKAFLRQAAMEVIGASGDAA
jgi:radical SAM superfamily enzyme YgiQ (UPF0313 family)